MRHLALAAASALVLAATLSPALAADTPKEPDATAVLMDASGARKGSVGFTQTKEGLAITVAATGLPAGTKGIHIHSVGKCEGPGFDSAGAHWNPAAHQHGTENPQGSHMGDLKNIVIGTDGAGALAALIPNGRLKDGPMPLMDADGAAVVVHTAADDYKTDPSGNSGKRIACGVVQMR